MKFLFLKNFVLKFFVCKMFVFIFFSFKIVVYHFLKKFIFNKLTYEFKNNKF